MSSLLYFCLMQEMSVDEIWKIVQNLHQKKPPPTVANSTPTLRSVQNLIPPEFYDTASLILFLLLLSLGIVVYPGLYVLLHGLFAFYGLRQWDNLKETISLTSLFPRHKTLYLVKMYAKIFVVEVIRLAIVFFLISALMGGMKKVIYAMGGTIPPKITIIKVAFFPTLILLMLTEVFTFTSSFFMIEQDASIPRAIWSACRLLGGNLRTVLRFSLIPLKMAVGLMLMPLMVVFMVFFASLLKSDTDELAERLAYALVGTCVGIVYLLYLSQLSVASAGLYRMLQARAGVPPRSI